MRSCTSSSFSAGAPAADARSASPLAALAFVSIDFYFQPPYGRFEISKRPDWMVLIAFMAAALVATQLLARANEKAHEASRRADEIDRLAALGAETLSTGQRVAGAHRDRDGRARHDRHGHVRDLGAR